MASIDRHAESSNFFTLNARLRSAEAVEADEILDTLVTMRDRSPCAAIRLRCTLLVVKHRGLRARIANGAIAALFAMLASFAIEVAALDGVISCLDLCA